MSQVVRLDSIQAIYGGGKIHSVQSDEVIQNGAVGIVGKLLPNEREVREFNKPTDLSKDKAVLVAQEEINYDESRKTSNDLKKFSIRAGLPFRAYDLGIGDIYSVSVDAINSIGDKPEIDNKVVLTVGSHKLTEKTPSDVGGSAGDEETEATAPERFVGNIEALEQIGTTTFVGAPGHVSNVTQLAVIRVESN